MLATSGDVLVRTDADLKGTLTLAGDTDNNLMDLVIRDPPEGWKLAGSWAILETTDAYSIRLGFFSFIPGLGIMIWMARGVLRRQAACSAIADALAKENAPERISNYLGDRK